MKLFKDNAGKVYAYDEEAIALGYGSNMTPLTEQEEAEHIARNSSDEVVDE